MSVTNLREFCLLFPPCLRPLIARRLLVPSVRCSGYGFVLYVFFSSFMSVVRMKGADSQDKSSMSRFGSVDAAERCIESLRKYRNLHPSFSKVYIS